VALEHARLAVGQTHDGARRVHLLHRDHNEDARGKIGEAEARGRHRRVATTEARAQTA